MKKHICRFLVGGSIYTLSEILWRLIVNHRSTHIVVFFLAGLVYTLLMWLEDKHLNMFINSFIGCIVTTLGELVIGLISVDIFNTRLWHYGGITYRGIICLHWSLLWFEVCFAVICVHRIIRRIKRGRY